MEYYDLMYNSKFDDVWQRVTASQNQQPHQMGRIPGEACHTSEEAEDIPSILRGFMSESAADACMCLEICKRCSNSCTRKTLTKIASDECEMLRELQTIYFIITGETYAPVAAAPNIISSLEALRALYISETESAARFLEIANSPISSEIPSDFFCFADKEKLHANLIKEIIERNLTNNNSNSCGLGICRTF